MSLDKTQLCTELTVKEKIFETEDAASIVLEIPESLKTKFNYKAGQFVTFFIDINGEEVRRSYSLSSCPASDKSFKVTIKRVAGGKVSNFVLDKIDKGSKLWTTPPAGLFVLPKDYTQYKLVFFAAGSGITPILSIIKNALNTNPSASTALLYQNRKESSIIFKKEIDALKKQYGERFVFEHVLDEADATWIGRKGITDKTLIRDFLAKNLVGIKAYHFMCGPEGYMKVVERALADLGVDSSQIKKESFSTSQGASAAHATPGEDFQVDSDGILIGNVAQKSKPVEIEATFDSQTVIIKTDGKKTILESLLAAGYNPPYSCMDGACMACLAKVNDGLVYQLDLGILTEDNTIAKECLTCQARPCSQKVKINYDTY
jgi:ring-1,2-phenylacetyl-CoA epoxidase subunit PaaE